MKTIVLSGLLIFLIFAVSSADAELIDRGGGLIYDVDKDITWLQDANYAKTSGYDYDGLMNVFDATKWVSDLNYQGYDDWTFPTNWYYRSHMEAYEQSAQENLIHLFQDERVDYYNPGPFINIQQRFLGYRTGAVVYFGEQVGDVHLEYSDFASNVYQGYSDFSYGQTVNRPPEYFMMEAYVLPIRYGDSSPTGPVAPEPISSALFIVGGAMLAGRRYLKKKKIV